METTKRTSDSTRTDTMFRRFVSRYLHPSGKKSDVLTTEQKRSVYVLCDGFEDPPDPFGSDASEPMDWSHVRDSSDAAMKRASRRLATILHNQQSR